MFLFDVDVAVAHTGALCQTVGVELEDAQLRSNRGTVLLL